MFDLLYSRNGTNNVANMLVPWFSTCLKLQPPKEQRIFKIKMVKYAYN